MPRDKSVAQNAASVLPIISRTHDDSREKRRMDIIIASIIEELEKPDCCEELKDGFIRAREKFLNSDLYKNYIQGREYLSSFEHFVLRYEFSNKELELLNKTIVKLRKQLNKRHTTTTTMPSFRMSRGTPMSLQGGVPSRERARDRWTGPIRVTQNIDPSSSAPALLCRHNIQQIFNHQKPSPGEAGIFRKGLNYFIAGETDRFGDPSPGKRLGMTVIMLIAEAMIVYNMFEGQINAFFTNEEIPKGRKLESWQYDIMIFVTAVTLLRLAMHTSRLECCKKTASNAREDRLDKFLREINEERAALGIPPMNRIAEENLGQGPSNRVTGQAPSHHVTIDEISEVDETRRINDPCMV